MSDYDDIDRKWRHRVIRRTIPDGSEIGVAIWDSWHPTVYMESLDGKFRKSSDGTFMPLRDYDDGR